jgi:excinuclease ABC subunit C
MTAPATLREIIRSIPEQPGIYKYYNADQQIIYIGKARNLKKRVNSYFTKQKHENYKTKVLVNKIQHIEYTVVNSEIDALLLENNLVKEFQPRYNIMLRDDKSFPFIKITKERFPRVFSMRNPVKDGSEYYGPYISVRMMKVILELIKKLYHPRTCTYNLSEKNVDAGKYKVCLEYHLGNCLGPCENLQSEPDYDSQIQQIRNILRGNLKPVKDKLEEYMQEASEKLAFEEAAVFKTKLSYLEMFQSKSAIVNPKLSNIDIFSITDDQKKAYVNYLKLVNGMIVSSDTVELRKALDEGKQELLEKAIAYYRLRFNSSAKEIIIPFALDLKDENIKFTVPKSGDKHKLLQLSIKNVLTYKKEKRQRYERLNPELRVDRVMNTMMSDLNLKDQPRHIECFDNSNLQGTDPVAACVVFRNGKAFKKDYRHFNIKTVIGPDDFSSMKEVVKRRYSRLLKENKSLPNLIIVDGGKGQLSSSVETLKELEIYDKVAIIGIAKRLEEIYFPDDPIPLYIDKKSETLKIIQQLRDEAHRFGITHHRNRRSKRNSGSSLEQIEGIGPGTALTLLKHFRSVKKVRAASFIELSSLIGKSKAELVSSHFKTDEKN